MKGTSSKPTFDQAMASSAPDVRDLARGLRHLIQAIHPEVVEVAWPRQRIVGYGIGPKKMSEHYCYIAAHKAHVNLGFYYGARLPDPNHVLEGTGKLLRHIKLRSKDELTSPHLRRIVQAALQERRDALHPSM